MFMIDNLNITITRGDTATMELTFEGDAPESGDTVAMALKTGVNKQAPIWEKSGSPDSEGVVRFDIGVGDTAGLPFGTYWWDLRVFYADGQVTTPFAPRRFVIQEVITNDRE